MGIWESVHGRMGISAWVFLSLPPSLPPSQSASGVTERTRLDANMPDVCIAYQLHLECGRLINLYDWLQVCGIFHIPYDLSLKVGGAWVQGYLRFSAG